MPRSLFANINLFIRSLLFSVYSIVSIVLYSFVCLLAIPFPLRTRHAVIRSFIRVYLNVLKFLCGIKYEVEGLEHIKGMHAGVVLSKHQSTWETFYLPLIFHAPAVIVKKELLRVPFFGWGLATSDPISIDRKDRTSAMQQVINKGQVCLDSGRWVILFPEGTRVPAGKVGKYRLGGARLAVATGYPVIPVAHNAGRFWPRRKFLKYPGTVKVVIGPAIQTTGRTPEEVLRETKSWIESTIQQIDPTP